MIRFGSLFAGIGGGDLGLEQAGMKSVWQVEKNSFCLQLLEQKWPEVIRENDITKLNYKRMPKVSLIIGGDPCQCRSRAKISKPSKYPDLSGHFLAVAGRFRPRWVVRENVCAPDVNKFAAGLGLQGYGVVIVELDSKYFTAQRRTRQYVIGGLGYTSPGLGKAFCERATNCGRCKEMDESRAEPYAVCLTTQPCSFYPTDDTIYENGKGIRVLSAEERERLQGFPVGWTAEFSFTRRVHMLGNAMTVPVIEWIGRTIVLLDKKKA